jgi:hypothetical protein
MTRRAVSPEYSRSTGQLPELDAAPTENAARAADKRRTPEYIFIVSAISQMLSSGRFLCAHIIKITPSGATPTTVGASLLFVKLENCVQPPTTHSRFFRIEFSFYGIMPPDDWERGKDI